MARKKKDRQEIDELDEIYAELAGPPAKKARGKTRIILISCIIALLVIGCGVGIYSFLFGTLFDPYLIMPDVTLGGIPLANMTRQEAKIALENTAYLHTDMQITVEDTIIVLTPEQMHLQPDWNAAVNAAYRNGSVGQFDISPYLNLNETVLNDVLSELGATYNRALQQTVCTVEGQAPSLIVGEENDNTHSMTLTIQLGAPSYGLDVALLRQQILDAYNRHEFQVTGQCQIIQPEIPDAKALLDQYGILPIDAVMDPKTFVVTPDVYGYGFDAETVSQQIADTPYGQTLTVPFTRIQAEITGESLSSILFRDVLGTCKTPYSGSDNNNRNTNLRLACEAINGKVVFPGETFTYNYTLGERTADRGYKPAASYVNGKTVDTYGGGICQVSSTLYYCTLLADLEIVERWPHGYISSYIEAGMDASVSWNSGDFRFKNNFNYPIRIEAYREKGYVYVQLIGTDEKDYYVVMTHQTLGSTKYETKYEEIKEAENKQGYKDGQVLVTPYTGYNVKTFKNKYDKQTKELISSELEAVSNYSKRDQVIVKIIKETPPETTKPEDSEAENEEAAQTDAVTAGTPPTANHP